MNEVGKKLKPKVKYVLQLANRGAGKPDGGLFTADQFEKLSDAEPLPGQLRGVDDDLIAFLVALPRTISRSRMTLAGLKK